MTTPICDFVCSYARSGTARLHMPGHKGNRLLGPEARDITEIQGADVLYSARGIIRESEKNAAALFGSRRTVYSTEGSSLCIRAMVYLAVMHAGLRGRRARIAVGRNAHRVFLEAAALLDPELVWVGTGEELLRGTVTPETLNRLFASEDTAPTAVYVTSPDYLGNVTPLEPLAEVCRRHDALLLADNAHGAYLKFLRESRHPLDQGADFCCDSAHKTLPVLTGGAYLHAGRGCPEKLVGMMERAMAFFASTSPSYLTLQSLDRVNVLLAADYPERIRETAARLEALKRKLEEAGWPLTGDEALKLTLCPKTMGYTGLQLADLLRERGIECEFADPDYLVLMISPETGNDELNRTADVLLRLEKRTPIAEKPPVPGSPDRVLSPREASLRPFETVTAEESEGRILASPSVSCPPAVPICICGERIDRSVIELFRYYGTETCDVVMEQNTIKI